MKKKRKVILTDWDGTIRKGFTLHSWVKFLSQESKISPHYVEKVEELFKVYYRGDLSHDLLAKKTAEIYAKSLKGYPKTGISILAKEFVECDGHNLYDYSTYLFDFLISKSIGIIVISGAPLEILEQYREKFNLYRVYGLEIETDSKGLYTGRIKQNFGLSQQKELLRLTLDKEFSVIIGLGNSYADIAILRNVQLAIILDNYNLNIEGKKVYIKGSEVKGNEIVRIIEKEVKL